MNLFFDKDDPFIISLREYCSKLPDEKIGINSVPGVKMTEDIKKSISDSLRGRKLTEDHKRKIGKANSISKAGSIPWNKGKKVNSINYKKTECDVLHPNGTLERVINMKEFCIKHNLSTSNMSQVVNGKQHHHKGYKVIHSCRT